MSANRRRDSLTKILEEEEEGGFGWDSRVGYRMAVRSLETIA
jgi:hypothetical protein